jgi:hypothetical protein
MAFDLKFVIHFCKELESTTNIQQFLELTFILDLVEVLEAVCHLYASPVKAFHCNIISSHRCTRFVNSVPGKFPFLRALVRNERRAYRVRTLTSYRLLQLPKEIKIAGRYIWPVLGGFEAILSPLPREL